MEIKHASDKGLEALLMNTEGGQGASREAVVDDQKESCRGERFEGRRWCIDESRMESCIKRSMDDLTRGNKGARRLIGVCQGEDRSRPIMGVYREEMRVQVG